MRHWFVVGLVVVGVALVWPLSVLSDNLARRRLQRWAAANGYHLIEFHQAWAWQGPRAWRRTRAQQDYRVVVHDAQGNRREGWLLGTYGWLGFGGEEYEEQWDNPVS